MVADIFKECIAFTLKGQWVLQTSLKCEAGCCCTENTLDPSKVALTMEFLRASCFNMSRSGNEMNEMCVNKDCMI